MNLSLVAAPGNVCEDQLHDRVQALVAPVLVDDRIAVAPADPVGGGPPCAVEECPRPMRFNGFCDCHNSQLRNAGRPEISSWTSPRPNPGPELLDLGRLPIPLRWEIAYGIVRAREVPDPPQLRLGSLQGTINQLISAGIVSLLDHSEADWPATQRRRDYRETHPSAKPPRLQLGFLTFTIDQLDELTGRVGREYEYSRDIWRLRRLGVAPAQQGWTLDFTGIDQPWLRRVVKQFMRWRHETEHSCSGMHRDLISLTRLARALTDTAGPNAQPANLNRAAIERLLGVLVEDGLTATGRNIALSSVKKFLVIARQHDWIPEVPARTAIYSEDFPQRIELPARGLSEFVMAQLENTENLAKLPDPRWKLLFPLLMETGLRLNDALHLGQDCIVVDQHNAPYLRYFNRKMKREALVPISEEIAAAIRARCQLVRDEYSPRAVLLPRPRNNPDGLWPTSQAVAQSALQRWIAECSVVDENGLPVHVTAHQFRHTLGTRLINYDVPQEVVRKLLDHTSTEMTAHYARLHDTTVREHWARARKVDIHGNDVTLAEDSPLADAEWAKHHLSRATMALPNGYCGLPLQQSCPHSNACLTCPVFITTPEFLPQHREQLEMTRGIIERAEKRGQLRLIEMNRRTADNLTKIIGALEGETTTNGSVTNDAG